MKVIVTGGGTAGHVNPALSIAKTIEKLDDSAEIEFIGTQSGIESRLVPKAGYNISYIKVYGLIRSLSPKNVKVAYMAMKSYLDCSKLLKEKAPDVVVGTGGYVTWPVCRAAASLGIPTVLHEANAVPGFAVKMLRKKANVIFVNFEGTKKMLSGAKGDLIRIGMPIHENFYKYTKESARKELGIDPNVKMILSFGGSLGAKTINDAVIGFMDSFVRQHKDVYHVHSTGSRFYKECSDRVSLLGLDKYENISVNEYLYDIPKLMIASDLVICRSGASTLSELASCSKPSVLIPSPNVTNNQQFHNAKEYSDLGAAVMIEDADLSPMSLEKTVKALLDNEKELEEIGARASEFEVKNSERILFEKIKAIAQNKKA
jgi:UDP-N-acetylglucosamine--N-acetylmuramyl-(pentapeptide) pyrophosphoryl-undecaprenol N-acetylglucosamine transferase